MQHYLFDAYRPTEEEEYMCRNHLEYFKNKLLVRRRELVAITELFLIALKENDLRVADMLDQSKHHAEMFLDFTDKQRQDKTLREIDLALVRIESGEYGYCEITGEEIGLKRLEVQPFATRCVEAQKMVERAAFTVKARVEEW